MSNQLITYLKTLSVGEAQRHESMAVYPLLASAESSPIYITMKKALELGVLTVTEVSQGGSVPTLKVRNDGEDVVLLLDGEELKGAKQNRVLNTSVLVPPKSELEVPVSCTEAGRWSYNSDRFRESGNVLPSTMRASKSQRVNESLKDMGRFDADQGRVWDEISQMHRQHGTHSSTGAMEDVFINRRENLNEVTRKFPRVEGQCGILVCFREQFTGLDLLSMPEAWRDLHDKIIRSYAIDIPGDDHYLYDAYQDNAMEWLLGHLAESTVTSRKSVSLGEDLRIESSRIIGSALFWENAFVHTAIYALPHAYREPVRSMYHSPRHRL